MAEAKSRYIDYYPDEFISGVAAKMPYEEQGMYWMICSLIMSNGGPIENDLDHLARLGCLSKTKAKNLLSKLLKRGKIIENDGVLSQKRAENEVKKAIKRIEIAQNNGAKGGRPSKKNKDLEKPTGLFSENLTINHQPSTNKEYVILLKDGTEFSPTSEDLTLWKKTFNFVNFDREFSKMEIWLDANPSKRKTRRGAKTFISGWLSRAHDNEKPTERPTSNAPSAGTAEAEQAMLDGYGEPFSV